MPFPKGYREKRIAARKAAPKNTCVCNKVRLNEMDTSIAIAEEVREIIKKEAKDNYKGLLVGINNWQLYRLKEDIPKNIEE